MVFPAGGAVMTFVGDAAVCASAGVMRLAAIRAAAAIETLFIMSIPIVTAAASCGAALARGTRPLVRSLRSCTIFIQQASGRSHRGRHADQAASHQALGE